MSESLHVSSLYTSYPPSPTLLIITPHHPPSSSLQLSLPTPPPSPPIPNPEHAPTRIFPFDSLVMPLTCLPQPCHTFPRSHLASTALLPTKSAARGQSDLYLPIFTSVDGHHPTSIIPVFQIVGLGLIALSSRLVVNSVCQSTIECYFHLKGKHLSLGVQDRGMYCDEG